MKGHIMKTPKSILAALLFSALACSAFADNELVADVQGALRANSQLSNYYIQVDSFEGLVVLHGWVRTRRLRNEAANQARQVFGVERVYNYITTDDNDDSIARNINRSYRIQNAQANMNDRIGDLGTVSESAAEIYPGTRRRDPDAVLVPQASVPVNLGSAAKERLDADPILSIFRLSVDNYKTVVLLHGTVPDSRTARDAEKIAARTPGVKKVVSYLNVPETTSTRAPVWPFVVDLRHSEIERKPVPRAEFVDSDYEVNQER